MLFVPPGFPRDVRGLRHRIIDRLETHEELWPPACPPLEPIRLTHTRIFIVVIKLLELLHLSCLVGHCELGC